MYGLYLCYMYKDYCSLQGCIQKNNCFQTWSGLNLSLGPCGSIQGPNLDVYTRSQGRLQSTSCSRAAWESPQHTFGVYTPNISVSMWVTLHWRNHVKHRVNVALIGDSHVRMHHRGAGKYCIGHCTYHHLWCHKGVREWANVRGSRCYLALILRTQQGTKSLLAEGHGHVQVCTMCDQYDHCRHFGHNHYQSQDMGWGQTSLSPTQGQALSC